MNFPITGTCVQYANLFIVQRDQMLYIMYIIKIELFLSIGMLVCEYKSRQFQLLRDNKYTDIWIKRQTSGSRTSQTEHQERWRRLDSQEFTCLKFIDYLYYVVLFRVFCPDIL